MDKKWFMLIMLIMIGILIFLWIEKSDKGYNPNHVNTNIKYGDSTLKESGGLLLCMKYGIDRLLNENGDIKEYIKYAEEKNYKLERYGTSFNMIEDYSKVKGLNVRKINRTDIEGLHEALKNNSSVIMLCGNGNFTQTGKYILLFGLNETDGNDNVIEDIGNQSVRVYDPTSKDISKRSFTLYYIINNSTIVMEDETSYWEIYK